MVDYNKKYYKDNKDDLLEYRKTKYDTDAEYRKKQKRRSRQQYMRQRLKTTSDGRSTFSVSEVAKFCKRNVVTIRKYLKTGVIPAPLYHNTRGWGLFTRNQTLLLQSVFSKLDNKHITMRELILILKEGWENGEEESRGEASNC